MSDVTTALTRLRRAAAVLLSVALLTALPAAAQAQSRSARDARHDIVNIKGRNPDIRYRLPGMRLGDLTGSRVTYTRHRITVVTRFRELNHRRPDFYLGLPMAYVNRDGRLKTFEPLVLVADRDWGGQVMPDGPRDCRFAHRIDYRRDTIRVSFPSSCIGSPAWVRTAAISLSFHRGYVAVDMMPRQNVMGSRIEYGVRVHRG